MKGPLALTAEGVTLHGEDDELDIEPGAHALSERRAVGAGRSGRSRWRRASVTPNAGDGMKPPWASPTIPRGVRAVDARSGVSSTMRADT